MSKATNKFPLEVRKRAVRMVLDDPGRHGSRGQAIVSIATEIGCSAKTLNDWVKKAEVDGGRRAGVTPEMAERLKALEQAVHQRQPGMGLVHHSDRGSHFLSIRYTEHLSEGGIEAGIELSVGSCGNSYDAPLAETINGL